MRWLLPLFLTLMPEPSVPPPLRVRTPDGTFNQIPVFELEVSGGTLQKVSPIRTRLLIDSGGGGSGAPTNAPYVTYSANATLSAELILTAGSSVTLVTDATAIYINALTGGGGTTVYAATGNQYVTISAAADLTDEYIIRPSTGISLTSAGNVLLVHYGSLLVTTSRSVSTLYPLTGGGDLSADRTFSADTAFLVTSARAINTTAPLAGGGNLGADRTLTVDTLAVVASGRSISTLYPISGGGNLSADRTFAVDTAFLITSARTLSVAGGALAGGGNLGTDRTITLGTPVAVGSGGTGQVTLTQFGLLYGSGASAIQATSGLNAGMLVVGSGLNQNLAVIGSGTTGQVLISTGGSIPGNVAWVNTLGGASSVVYAATGNQYVTIGSATDLTDAFLLRASTGISLTSASNIVLIHYGSLLVTSTRAINTTAPLAGGGNLSADRTLTVDTAAVVTSGRSISTLYPISGGGNLSADRTFAVDTAFLINSSRTISFSSGFLVGGGDLSANRTISYVLPIAVGTGGTGQTTLTAQGVLIGSGTTAVYSTSGLNAGMLLVGSGLGMNPQIVGSGGAGTMLISSGGSIAGNVAWVATGGGGGSGTITAGSGGNIAFYSGDGTTVDDIPVIGSGTTLLGVNTGGTAHVYKVLAAGANITLAHTNTGLTISATTGGPGTGTVNTGSGGSLGFYKATGTTIDSSSVLVTTGGGIAQFNVAILTAGAASPVSGDVWIQASNNRIYLFVYSNALAFGVELTN